MRGFIDIGLFRHPVRGRTGRDRRPFVDEPLDHPDLRSLGPRELADLPVPRWECPRGPGAVNTL